MHIEIKYIITIETNTTAKRTAGEFSAILTAGILRDNLGNVNSVARKPKVGKNRKTRPLIEPYL